MNSPVKRLLTLLVLGAVGAVGLYLARQAYSAPPDNYQNGTPPVNPNAKGDYRYTPEEFKKLMDKTPKAGMGG